MLRYFKRQEDQEACYKKQKIEKSRILECPICNRTMLSSIIEMHVNECINKGISNPPSGALTQVVHNNHKTNLEKNNTTKISQNGPNAMKILMENANCKPFFLYFLCRPTLICDMTSGVEPNTVWETDMTVLKKSFIHKNGRKYQGLSLSIRSFVEPFKGSLRKATLDAARPYLSCDVIKAFDTQALPRISPGFLKSILQKSIRRNKVGSAIWSAVAMILAGEEIQFFRRFPIIVLEDSILHTEFDFLVWCMLSVGRGFVPNTYIMRRYFRILHDVCLCDKRDADNPYINDREFDFSNDTHLTLDQKTKYQNLVLAIRIRASFGGMQGDVDALLKIAKVWEDRFASAQANAWFAVLGTLENVKKQVASYAVGIPLSAMDFHCYPPILELPQLLTIRNEHHISIGDVKSMMWDCDCSLNYRTTASTLDEIKCRNDIFREDAENTLWERELKPIFTSIRHEIISQKLGPVWMKLVSLDER